MYRIGVLVPGPPPAGGDGGQGTDPFIEGLRELGYTERKNIVIEWRFADGRLERLSDFAAELVRLPVDVIVVAGPSPLRAAIEATTRIPIVMSAASSDPVGEGLVASLARPGGNVTGLTFAVSPERFGKQLELLKSAAPHIARIAVWWDTDIPTFHRSWATPLNTAASQLGLKILPPVQVLEPSSIDAAFYTMKQQRADALLVVIAGATQNYRARVAEMAVRNRLPTVAAQKSFTLDGGLISYGPDFAAIYRRAATYVDKILKGANPGELPIELPTRYELFINLKTAKALDLTIPQSLLLRADEVIH
ncbi:MAG: ABC transporter substrate-binding protein [Casimicrobiaceae bacterium]